MANSRGFNSQPWWPHITRLANAFVDFVNHQTNGNGNAAVLKMKNLEQVKDTYHKNLKAFKRKFYGKKNTDKHNLDVHKIVALYINAFLDVSPFYIFNLKHGIKSNFTEVQLYPNEYFTMELMKLILISWNESKNVIRIKENERKWFIGLQNHFRLDMIKLDILSLASIIYYIEDKYLCSKTAI
jgi:hypothetical protein